MSDFEQFRIAINSFVIFHIVIVIFVFQNWLGEVREYAKETVQITLIGNKIDLNNQRKVKADEARQLAQVLSE